MDLIPEHIRQALADAVAQAEPGEPFDEDVQDLLVDIDWQGFEDRYGVSLGPAFIGEPLTEDELTALRTELRTTRKPKPAKVEEDIWI